jgi:hypothetical protein
MGKFLLIPLHRFLMTLVSISALSSVTGRQGGGREKRDNEGDNER